MHSPNRFIKTSRSTTVSAPQRAAAGAKGVAIEPPDYGIAFVDPRSATAAPIQRMAGAAAAMPAPGRSGARAGNTHTGLPDQLKSGIEALSGLSLDAVRVHRDSPRPAEFGALAYTQGGEIHVGPGQERHLPHEAWHVVQQAQGRVTPTVQMKGGVALNDATGLEHEADLMGARALAVGASTVPAAGQSLATAPREAVAFAAQPAAVMQRYTEERLPEEGVGGNPWRVSEDEQAMLEITQSEGGQTLWATEELVSVANEQLKRTGENGSFVRLVAGKQTRSKGGHSLQQVLPKYRDRSGDESVNPDMASANKRGGADSTGDTQSWFKMYADCGRSSRVVMGSLGLGPKALYQSGAKSKETARAFDPEEWTDLVYLESMKAFVKDPANRAHLKTEHLKERFLSCFFTGDAKLVPKAPESGQEAKAFAGYLDDAGQQAFAEYAKINVAVNPKIGEGYTMATGHDLPGFSGGAKSWNFHWAGVVMKSGSDNITLENYAVMFPSTGDPVKDAENEQRAYDYTNTDWVFQMYGTVKMGQTFHEEHLRSGTHGTKGTTLRAKI